MTYFGGKGDAFDRSVRGEAITGEREDGDADRASMQVVSKGYDVKREAEARCRWMASQIRHPQAADRQEYLQAQDVRPNMCNS